MNIAALAPFLALSMVLPLVAQESPSSEPTVVAAKPVQQAFDAALQQVLKSQSEDLYAVALAVLDAGGSEVDFFRLMKQAADAGMPVAQKWLAQYVLQSAVEPAIDLSTAPNAIAARRLMKQAADAGYVPAQVEMARYVGSGVGAAADEAEGMQYLMRACAAGSRRGRAAYLLLSGRLDGGKFDAPETASELQKGNFHLEEVIASMYGEMPESVEWLRKAMEHGSPVAPLLLAQRSSAENDSLKLLRLSAERHQPEALAAYGAILLSPSSSSGVERNTSEGIRHLQLAVMLGNVSATSTLAGQYMNNPDTYSAERVFDLYNIATVLQDPRASVAYAYCLVCGRGCSPEPEKGVAMLRQLADAGSPYAHVALADLYFNGTGVEPDMFAAINHLGEAGTIGVPNTYAIMAAMTQMGNAKARPDERRAELYLLMAEEQGHTSAREVYNGIIARKNWTFLPPAPTSTPSS